MNDIRAGDVALRLVPHRGGLRLILQYLPLERRLRGPAVFYGWLRRNGRATANQSEHKNSSPTAKRLSYHTARRVRPARCSGSTARSQDLQFHVFAGIVGGVCVV